MTSPGPPALRPSPSRPAASSPLSTSTRDAQHVALKLEVPGVKQENLDIRVENDTLTVKGERRFEAEEKEENFHRIERRFGSFVRSFTLPQTVDADTVKASYENGVLSVTIAKKAESKPKQIKVELGGSSASTPRQVEATTANA